MDRLIPGTNKLLPVTKYVCINNVCIIKYNIEVYIKPWSQEGKKIVYLLSLTQNFTQFIKPQCLGCFRVGFFKAFYICPRGDGCFCLVRQVIYVFWNIVTELNLKNTLPGPRVATMELSDNMKNLRQGLQWRIISDVGISFPHVFLFE